MSALGQDLDKTIVAAVNARVEAAVLEALSGDEVIGRLVTAALQQKIQARGSYQTKSMLQHVIDETIHGCVQRAVAKALDEEVQVIEDAVRKQLKRDAASVAAQLVGAFRTATDGYGLRIDITNRRS